MEDPRNADSLTVQATFPCTKLTELSLKLHAGMKAVNERDTDLFPGRES